MGVRFGLLGTGFWANETHAAALDAHPDAELVGVWGRDPAKAAALAERYGAQAHQDVDALLKEVDAVAIALPPDVQAELALRAARAGCHLLLDKPVSLSTSMADQLTVEAESRELASVVFFTARFSEEVERFHSGAQGQDWHGARAHLFASIFEPGNPFGASPWRRAKGGLWDLGPHALALTLPVLGQVQRVSALAGPKETVHLLTEHAGGAVGSFALTVDAPTAAQTFEVVLHGEQGWRPVPTGSRDPVSAFGTAVDRLIAQIDGEKGDPCGVRFGRDVVAVLEAAEWSLSSGRTERVAPAPGW
ncbi:Gfo/Idh/MocA family protein [Nocardiopsis kunsanensis]|uniref:Gfo/Idh/MocA family protein n=1 Tax=Nocardiopsis kunsanensis TaxID=141693 RepID=UPI00034DC667|nr:Gfo/Idh/MocA family oxidoreductase [Nocardiopsis kunsanensis]